MVSRTCLFLSIIAAACASTSVGAFSPPTLSAPILGLGAVLFKPRNKIAKCEDEAGLVEAGRFFVDAFWTGKIGGASELTQSQASSLERQQIAEFKKRYKVSRPATGRLPGNYAGRSQDKESELVLCLDSRGECMGCAGIEVETIKTLDGYDGSFRAPLMSNLAIGRQFRRKGLAEDLVSAAESIARKEWGYDECYLYVEKRNAPAVKLYKKLGYKVLWEDDTATTLLPKENGRVANGQTTILCMKKNLNAGLFGMFA